MKGISMVFTLALLIAAHLLARHLNKSGNLPAVRRMNELPATQTIGQSRHASTEPMVRI
jgi:hypothetical protein